ncbi:GLPGLI family protein [Tenacibaculum lutimaris]|uniref:GLPGLI family protein n=1 Tax=Tenacibaculum lutimaris TaxID=285258 RepID=A0A420DZI6_9FLAO|nr:GLPGLI family protein [Tenacibaculum lutimaris]RKF03252.1 GLPGLI family protein [Tenacibaculum lutimaris]
MKNKIFPIFLWFLFLIKAYTQTGEVTYNVESIKQNNLDNPLVMGVGNELQQKTFTLKYNKGESIFKKNKNIPINKRYSRLADVLIGGNYTWYQNSFTKEALVTQDIGGKIYTVSFPNMVGWELNEDTKVIEGYTCYKAIRKQLNKRTSVGKDKRYIVYIAWYTPEIPASFGPAGNGGLPGLILQLDKVNVARYTATKIKLNHKKNIKIPKLKEATKITPERMVVLMRKARKVTVD